MAEHFDGLSNTAIVQSNSSHSVCMPVSEEHVYHAHDSVNQTQLHPHVRNHMTPCGRLLLTCECFLQSRTARVRGSRLLGFATRGTFCGAFKADGAQVRGLCCVSSWHGHVLVYTCFGLSQCVHDGSPAFIQTCLCSHLSSRCDPWARSGLFCCPLPPARLASCRHSTVRRALASRSQFLVCEHAGDCVDWNSRCSCDTLADAAALS